MQAVKAAVKGSSKAHKTYSNSTHSWSAQQQQSEA